MNAITHATIDHTLDALRSSVPAVFADQAHESRSPRFGYVSTAAVLSSLLDQGFVVREAKQGRSREPGKAAYTKHLIRLQHRSVEARRDGSLGDLHPEIALRNAHDGTARYELHLGLLRLACLNGLLVAAGTFAHVSLPHTLRAVASVTEASINLIAQAPRVLEVARTWRSIDLSRSDQLAFADAARVVRFGDADGVVTAGVSPAQLLEPRRASDTGSDLWSTFNRVQENAVRGGLIDPRPARVVIADDASRRVIPARTLRTRPVRAVDGDVKLNKALWTLGEALAKAKSAA